MDNFIVYKITDTINVISSRQINDHYSLDKGKEKIRVGVVIL